IAPRLPIVKDDPALVVAGPPPGPLCFVPLEAAAARAKSLVVQPDHVRPICPRELTYRPSPIWIVRQMGDRNSPEVRQPDAGVPQPAIEAVLEGVQHGVRPASLIIRQ